MKLSLVNAALADGRLTIGKREAISFAIFLSPSVLRFFSLSFSKYVMYKKFPRVT